MEEAYKENKKKSVLLLKGLCKEKNKNRVLNNFFLEILSGEIINLIGSEESGKEELYSILFGEETADSGEIWFSNQKYINSRDLPVERFNGIFFIGNHDLIIPDLTVAENLYTIEKINYMQFSVPRRRMEAMARKFFRQFDIAIAPEKKAKELTTFECYILRLMRAYVKCARLIVIDDILDDYSFERIHQIIALLEKFKQEGISVLWLNNYPDAITDIADKVVVIRQGRNSMVCYKDEYNRQKVLECLIRSKNMEQVTGIPHHMGKMVLQMSNINNDYFQDLNFHCQQGEIVGVYDLPNKFSRELRRLLQGKRSYEGNILVDGQLYRPETILDQSKNQIGVVDGNTYQSMIFSTLSVQENLEISAYKKNAIAGVFINRRVKKYMDRIGMEICRNTLSGSKIGTVSRSEAMQIVYQRWQFANPRVLFCFQPFLRLDAFSRNKLEQIFLEFKKKKTGIVISSANISHLLPLCDRIVIVERNRITKEISRDKFETSF